MKEFNSGEPSGGRLDWRWPFAAGCLIVLLALLWRGISKQTADGLASTNAANHREVVIASAAGPRRFRPASASADEPTALPEQIVAGKVAKFARSRRELVRRLAEHYKVEVPPEVTRFFAAIEAGRLDEAESIFSDLRQGENDSGRPRFPELGRIWRPIQETWGIADEVRNWPAQKLLDYGEAVLGSLRPGMVYVGGTDPGCFIPTLLNETSDGERHIVLTQNALADSNYLDYLSFIHEGRLDTLSHGDSERAFQEYTTDARKRLEHDQQFPNEPKQVRAGEDIRIVDGKVQVSGQTSVMAINEKLFQRLLEKNPDASFAIEQSFPFKSTYAEAAPAGPIMELRVQDQQAALTPERATETVDYWRRTAQELLADPEATASSYVRLAYAKMATEQAALLLDRNYAPEGEQALRIATQIDPSSPEAVFRYVNLLAEQKRFDEAIPVAERAVKADVNNRTQFRDLLRDLNKIKNP